MRYAWLTDIHLNFIELSARQEFYRSVKNVNIEGILITGDIAEAPTTVGIILELINAVNKKVYFVLGNHDYYFSDIDTVRKCVSEATSNHENFYWLPATGPVQIDEKTILLGQDGWADGRLGDYVNSNVILNDSRLIRDLFEEKLLGRRRLLDKMQKLADEDASALDANLAEAIRLNPEK